MRDATAAQAAECLLCRCQPGLLLVLLLQRRKAFFETNTDILGFLFVLSSFSCFLCDDADLALMVASWKSRRSSISEKVLCEEKWRGLPVFACNRTCNACFLRQGK